MKRKIIALILSIMFVMSCLMLCYTTVSSATYVQEGDWKYEMPSQNAQEYYIAGYTGNSSRVKIPALFQTNPVTKISNNAFLNNTTLVYADIPATVESIGMNAFYGCSALEEIDIPDSVTSIGTNAFYGCTSLYMVNFAKECALTVIPRNCFSGCVSLCEITIPQGVTTISDRAFFGCKSLEYITVPPSVTSIGEKAFEGCTGLLAIYGYNNTYAHQYALENNITFASLGDYEYPAVPTTTVSAVPTVPVTSSDEPVSTVPVTTEPVTTVLPTTVPVTTVSPTTAPANKMKIGDADLSGAISIKDATLIQKYAAGLINLDRTQLFLANCDGVGGVNVKDATQIQKYCADFKNILFVGTEVEI